ncbi:MAG: SDR family NAD(P)-dependent oxidoreductase, partial [Myxococcota bacterium]
ANAFLDAFARWRRAQGLPGTSVAFGPWDDVGLAGAVDPVIRRGWAAEGIVPVAPGIAASAVLRLAAGDRSEWLVAPFDWAKWRGSRPGTHLVDELVAVDGDADATSAVGATALVGQVRAAPTGARRAMVVDHVQQVASRVLGYGPGKRLGTRDGFFDAGMDSLMAMDLRERLQTAIGAPLSATLAFDHPTVEAVADALLAVIVGASLAMSSGGPTLAETVVGSTEPIAIVGAACRLPGRVVDLDGLWALLEGGVDAIAEVPRDRFDVDRYFDPTPGTPGKTYSRWGGFVDGIDQFEPAFFGISPREALSLDPQQRMLLECSWWALEDAGIAPTSLGETRTGVYVGIGHSEYWHRFDPTVDEVDAYAGTGNETSFAAGRVSYVLGLQGPSMSVNTACSSSLVSVHMGVRALREGQCDVVVAGGVNAIVGPETTIWMSMLQALAPDGRCKTFDARADGYVRSEGCGMIVLKRLSDAVRDGDRIHAVIRGTAVNHDGASSGLTVPNGAAQQAVIRAALADAQVEPRSIGYVECHGTGTRLGDPIEVRALGTVLASGRGADAPLYLGSIKANLGHLEAGAGIAGLLRAMLAVNRGTVPPLALLDAANPALPLSEFPAIHLPKAPVAWTGIRRAGVSSFGISGTNAHLVIEQPPERAEPDRTTARPVQLLTVSGRTADQAKAQAAALADAVTRAPVPLADLALTLNVGRGHLAHRLALIAATTDDAVAQLRRAAKGAVDIHAAGDPPRVVFLCTGAGPQAFGMARALYDADPVFRAAFDDATRAADRVLERPLFDVIHPAGAVADSPLHDLAYTQPAMFALEWAMAALWRSWGIEPAAVIGHSTGQYVAACLAGVFDLETGIRLMAERARLMSDEPKIGEMVACFAAEDVVARYLAGHEADVSLAAINGPAEAVISGRAEVVNAIASRIEADGIEIRRLNISHAAHSPLMEPILDRFEAMVRATPLSAPRLPLIENVRGEVAGAEVTTTRYWRDHMRLPVQFHRGMRTLIDQGYRVFVELGNHPVLAGAGARCVDDTPDALFLPSLRRDRPDWEQLLDTAGRLHAIGAALDWAGFHRHAPGARIALPGVVYQRKRHWVDRVDRSGARVVGADWTYGVRWDAVRPNVDPFGSRGDRPLVVFADRSGITDALRARQHRRVVAIRPGTGPSRDGDDWTIDPADPAQVDQVLAELAPHHVVHLWALDAVTPTAGSAAGSMTAAALPAVGSALHLLQAAARHGQPTVWLVTRGAVAVGTSAPSRLELAQAPLLGLGATAAIELADQPVVRVDLDPDDTDPTLQLELVLNSGLREEQLAIRGGRHLARRLTRIPAQGGTAPGIRADGTYLVTGGLGAIGRHVARWLSDQGAGRVVLTSRRAADVGPLPERVEVLRGDVSDPADLARLLREIGAPITGVFHAAGVLDDGALPALRLDQFAPVWAPKVDGGWNLHRAIPDAELFVAFSSAASLLGNPGQANYAAANAFLDALCELRRAEGKHAVSLCWGPWADGGLATDAARQWSRGGVKPLAPSLAIQVLAQRLGGPEAVVGVVDLDWKRWPSVLPRIPAAVAALVERDEAAAPADRSVVATLRAAAPAERRAALSAVVVAEVAAILGTEPAEVDPRVGFFDAGMDSLMAVELSKRLKLRLERALPATLAFDHPNVGVLVDWLHAQLDLGKAEAGPSAALAAAGERRIDLDAPIAVVGLSCRMPGGANDPEAFWELLRSGRDPMREVPPERWDLGAFYDPTPGVPGKMYVREAGFVDHDLVEGFDPEFFGISPREAESLDPQQRMLLEVSYEALERAGLTTPALYHSRTGVFVGAGSSGYHQRFQQPGGPLYHDQYAGTGALEAFVSGRVAYVLGLHGPNLALNTACSSALVAIHLACQALRTGDAEVALAGGVHLMLSPENFVYVSQLRAVSADGRCKTFDAAADGYGRAEGCGMVALKRLPDALRDGDPVLAVIRGTAIGHDGPSSGLTVPYGPAQVQVLSDAVARSGIHPHDVTYIEAHGTGTVLGDPIEVHAIEEVYATGRSADNPLHIGAVKSNIGHLEVAAGAASVIKMALALSHREIPPHLHFREPNPDLDLASHGLVVDTAPTAWSSPRGPLRAGVSGFGLAGTNVHLVLEEAPEVDPPTRTAGPDRPVHLVTVSARSSEALRTLAVRYADRLAAGVDLGDLAFSAATTRIPYEHRLAVAAADAPQAIERLRGFAADGEAPDAASTVASGRSPGVVFLFSGQGSQYAGMGRELYHAWPVFRDVVDRCAAVLDPLLATPIRDVMFGESAAIDDTTFTQPALFVIEVALAALWRSWGVEPAAVIGHSIGQLAAACVAGVMSLEDGLRLVAERGRLMGALPRDGAMLAVFTDEATVRAAIAEHLSGTPAGVGIAAINNPGETTISGGTAAIGAIATALKARGVESRPLTVSHAFHSPLMEPMLAPFEAVARTVALSPPRIPVACNLTGQWATAAQLTDPAYWRDLVRSPVRFAAGLETVAADGYEVFVEIGPHTALLGMGKRTLGSSKALGWYPSLQRGEPAHTRLVPTLGALWARGVAVDLKAFDAPWTRVRVPLPTYPWQRRRVWL